MALREDESHLDAARRRWANKSPEDKAAWILKFARRDLRTLSRDARVAIGYDVRLLAGDTVGWGVRRRLGPLPDRALQKVHTAVRLGVNALQATKRAHPVATLTQRRFGWLLPAHRVRLVFAPLPAGTFEDDPSAMLAIYEAADEALAIVARLGYLLLADNRRWRICPCGCGDIFLKRGKQQFASPACATKVRQRRWRVAKRDQRARRGADR
jgi:hypothetical protein